MRSKMMMLCVFALVALNVQGLIAQISQIIIEDIFGRQLNGAKIILVDWEGYLANPAIKLFLKPPAGATLPGTAVISSPEPRMYFDLASTFSHTGPTKTITLQNSSSVGEFLVSIFPDRDTEDEEYTLNIQFMDANNVQTSESINIHVIDQDKDRPLDFDITVDFSQDQTGFFDDEQFRDLVVQAAEDWAYFIADMNLDEAPAGAESTFIWNSDGFISGFFTSNEASYKGFLLYAYGIHHEPLRSGGEGNFSGPFQTSEGVELPLKRSGGIEIETQGNFNTLGWYLATGDDDWWVSGNLSNETNDFLSVAHHDIGHALFFNRAYPIFEESKTVGFIEDAAVLAYHGSNPNIDSLDHFDGEVDNASRRGVFGYEYFGDMPRRRWLITKLDLLIAQAIGYQLRETSAFVPLSISDQSLPEGTVGEAYTAALGANGGVPFYNWTIASGTLPDGLTLDSFTGTISGAPSGAGSFNFVIELVDYAEDSVSFSTSIKINDTATSVEELDDVIPSTYELKQNYPNPFNPTTTIRYDLPQTSRVKIIIYNFLGQRVATLFEGEQPAGLHSLQWDAKDSTGRKVASGVYVYRIEAGAFVQAKKMVLLQ